MSWNSGSMGDFSGPTMKEAEEAEEKAARTRDEMSPLHRRVSDVLDDYLMRIHGISTSHTHPDLFIDLLKEEGIGIHTYYPEAVKLKKSPEGTEIPTDGDVFTFLGDKYEVRSVSMDGTCILERIESPSGLKLGSMIRKSFDWMKRYAEKVETPEPSFPPLEAPMVEIDEDFYVHGDTVMCRMEHTQHDGNVVGKMPEGDEELRLLLSKHDHVFHEGPGGECDD